MLDVNYILSMDTIFDESNLSFHKDKSVIIKGTKNRLFNGDAIFESKIRII